MGNSNNNTITCFENREFLELPICQLQRLIDNCIRVSTIVCPSVVSNGSTLSTTWKRARSPTGDRDNDGWRVVTADFEKMIVEET